MNIHIIILLIISIMLTILSSWNVSIFIRLKNASQNYTSDDVFDNSCHVSKKYVTIGYKFSTIMLILSILLMIFSSISIYNTSKSIN